MSIEGTKRTVDILKDEHHLSFFEQVWEDGQAFKDLKLRLQILSEQRESIEAARKVRG